MPSLKAIRQEMLRREPHLGRFEVVASGSATTIVVTALATGTVTASKYADKWLLRPDAAAAADRVRITTDTGFTTASGTLTHAGANYTNNATSAETVEIHEYEPYLLDTAINTGLGSTRHLDTTILPTQNAADRYFMNTLTWVTEPSDIRSVRVRALPVLNDNRLMEKWSPDTAGGFTADGFTLAGASGTIARSTTQVFRGQYSAAITRSGTDCTFTATIGILPTGVSNDTLRSKAVTIVLVAYSAVASQVRASIYDGVTRTNTSYHTGGSSFEELSTQVTVGTAATTLTIRAEVNSSNTVAYVDDLYACLGPVSDVVRRNDARTVWEDNQPRFETTSALQFIAPPYGIGSQYVFDTYRPYPQFDLTRVRAGTADADTTDCPLNLAAAAGLKWLFEGLSGSPSGTPLHAALATKWRRKYEQLALEHCYINNKQRTGMDLPLALAGRSAVRF